MSIVEGTGVGFRPILLCFLSHFKDYLRYGGKRLAFVVKSGYSVRVACRPERGRLSLIFMKK